MNKKIEIRKLLKRLNLKYEKVSNQNELILDCIDPVCPNPQNHLYLNENTGLWICHRCGIAGNPVVLVSIVKKTTAREAQKLIEEGQDSATINELKNHLKDFELLYSSLADEMEMKIFVPPPPSKLVTRKTYPKILNKRKIPFWLARRIGVKICNSGKYAGRLIFPYRCDGNVSFVAYATMGQKPKTLNPPGGQNDRMIYEYDYMNKMGYKYPKNTVLVVVEGIFDCLRVQTYGFPCVALLGSFLSKNQALLLGQMPYDELVFMLDGDISENNYWKQLRHIKYIDGKNIRFAPIPEKDKDPDMLTNQELIKILNDGTIPARKIQQMRGRLMKLKK